MMAGIALTLPLAYMARAETYLTADQAAKLLFPDSKLTFALIGLSPDEMKEITKKSGEPVLSSNVRVWWGASREALIIDQVVGKHEFITYAVAIDSDAKVKGVEIMDYRETVGYEVRRPAWRKQFIGKSSKDPVRIDKDIANISGATLSSVHVTNGVRRVLSTYDVIKTKFF